MKERRRESLRQQIRQILLSKSDPLGVKHLPHAVDEYDRYADTILEMLDRERDEAALTQYLCSLESGWLALPAKLERAKGVVRMILSLPEHDSPKSA